jgi:hypothetical protein
MKAILLLTAAAGLAAAQECRVSGRVISTEPETKLAPKGRQFRIRVADSPWDWQIGKSMPVTSKNAIKVMTGDQVEITCEFEKWTKDGRFWGEVRKADALPSAALQRKREPESGQ